MPTNLLLARIKEQARRLEEFIVAHPHYVDQSCLEDDLTAVEDALCDVCVSHIPNYIKHS